MANRGRPRKIENMFSPSKDKRTFTESGKSKGILDDYPTRQHIDLTSGTIQKAPAVGKDIANKTYVDAGGGTDEKVGVDSAATAGYIGAASSDGVLRTAAPINYTDGGDFVTLDVDTASATAEGVVELATDAETSTGTATNRATTPANIASLNHITASSTDTLTNKTLDANGTGNSVTNIDLTADVINDLPVAEGGTGASVAATALTNLGGIGAATTNTLTNKTFDANGTGNALSNVDVADLANGTDGELITWGTTGVAETVGVGTADQVLTSNGAGAAPTFKAAAGGGAWTKLAGANGTTASTSEVELATVTITAGSAYSRIVIRTFCSSSSNENLGYHIRLADGTNTVNLPNLTGGATTPMHTFHEISGDGGTTTTVLTSWQAKIRSGEVTGAWELPTMQNDTMISAVLTGGNLVISLRGGQDTAGTLAWSWQVFEVAN